MSPSRCVYSCHRVITSFPTNFKQQLELFSSHGVVVSPHGAGLMNVMYLVPFSAVVEVFPYHFDHNLYPTASVMAGLGYYPVHTYNASDMWSRYEVRQPAWLDDTSLWGVVY